MKSEELMIGDLVTFKDCLNDEEILVIKIWHLSQEGDALVFIDDSVVLDEIAIDDEIVGIPLTPEILEKNGFSKVFSKDWNMYEWKCRSIGTAWVDYENCIRMEIETNGVHITMPIHYIHELQHTLKLCGIEKTIEL